MGIPTAQPTATPTVLSLMIHSTYEFVKTSKTRDVERNTYNTVRRSVHKYRKTGLKPRFALYHQVTNNQTKKKPKHKQIQCITGNYF